MTQKNTLTSMIAIVGGLMTAACASSMPSTVPQEYLNTTVLERNAIEVIKKTEFLELDVDAVASEMTNKQRNQVRAFVNAYKSDGEGPLVLSLPQSSQNPQLAVSMLAEAREIAYEVGIAYDEVEGGAHHSGQADAPLIIAFQRYDAIAPDCKSAAAYDYSDISSNNELPSLGCSVRTNLAAMVAHPSDLLGQREIDPADAYRRADVLKKFRQGQPTGASRSDAETGSVAAVN